VQNCSREVADVASTVQFVDDISASPTVRLDLSSGAAGVMIARGGIDLSPPPMRRTVVTTPLIEGEPVTSSVPSNRVIKLPLQLTNTLTKDQSATLLQNLGRELSRDRNFLKVQLAGMTSPVFFRTYAAPDYVLSMVRMLIQVGRVELEIPAEPYGYGPKVTLPAVTVSKDPAGAGTDSMVPVLDTFTRSVTDGWGSADTGQAWTNSGGAASDYDVVGSTGTHLCTDVNIGRFSTLATAEVDFDIVASFATDKLAVGGSQFVYLLGRAADNNNCYLARIEFTTTATVILTIRKRVASVDTQIATFTT
jgi:hypothetical protein